MTRLTAKEKEMISYCNREFSKWFKQNKLKLIEADKKYKDFLLLVSEFFILRSLLLKHVVNIYGYDLSKSSYNLDYAAVFGVKGVCDPAINEIKSERFFWGYFGFTVFSIEFSSLAIENLRQTVDRLYKNKYSLEKKSSAYTAFMYIEFFYNGIHMNTSDTLLKRNIFSNQIKVKQEKIIELSGQSNDYFRTYVGDQKTIKVYRGFSYDTSKNVRVGRYLKSNQNAKLQDNGKSISFTLDKKIAKTFAVNFYVTETFVGDWSGRVNGNELLLKINDIDKEIFLEENGRRPVIGVYEVDVDDILLYSCNPNTSEYEIFVYPENARLIRYDPIKFSK